MSASTNAEFKRLGWKPIPPLGSRMSAGMVAEVNPERLGWKCIGPRRWQTPEGKIHLFPPGVPEVIVEFREIRDGEIMRIYQR